MLRRIVAMVTGFLAAGGCSASKEEPLPPSQPGSFAVIEVESKETPEGTLKTWRATSRQPDGQPFMFRIEMLLKPLKGELPMAFSNGAIIREPGADGTRFLNEVAVAIEAESDPPNQAKKVDRIEFPTAVLGTSLSRVAGEDVIGGSFTSTKQGNWMAFKLFLAGGEGEVYLNINPVSGLGEFTTKDPEYGEVVLRELATVFLP